MTSIVNCEPDHLEQVATLFTAHAACALPGGTVTAASIAARLERDPGEFVTGPWVVGRETLVALERERVAAAGQLVRYADDDRVSDSYRGAAELRWLCFWPRDHDAGVALLREAIGLAGNVTAFYLSGDLPGVLVYGIPDTWAHVDALARERGITPEPDRDEILLVGRLADLPHRRQAPPECTLIPGVAWSGDAVLTVRRRGENEARMEVATDLTDHGRNPAQRGAAAVWGPFTEAEEPPPEIVPWLWLESFQWLRLAGCDRVVAALVDREPAVELAAALGLRQVSRLRRGWALRG
jgi:hypothetical protein